MDSDLTELAVEAVSGDAISTCDGKIEADLWWLRIMRDLISSGLWKEMKPYAASIYVIVKAYANGQTGECRLSQEEIADLGGMSLAQGKRALTKLVKLGLLHVQKVSRYRRYTVIERVTLRVGDEDFATAIWNYAPRISETSIKEVKRMLEEQSLQAGVYVKIEHMQVVLGNGNIVAGGHIDRVVSTRTERGSQASATLLKQLKLTHSSNGAK